MINTRANKNWFIFNIMPQEDIKVTTSVQTLVEDTLSSQQEHHGGDLVEIG